MVLTKSVQKIIFCPNLGRGRGGKDQFIFVQNKNVQSDPLYCSLTAWSEHEMTE